MEEVRKIYGERLKSVILYGSYARGDFRPDSDIDIQKWLGVYPFYTNVQKEGVKLYGTAQEGKCWRFDKRKNINKISKLILTFFRIPVKIKSSKEF